MSKSRIILKNARIKKGMTQEQVADYLDVSLRTYKYIESGEVIGKVCVWDALEDLFSIHQRKLRVVLEDLINTDKSVLRENFDTRETKEHQDKSKVGYVGVIKAEEVTDICKKSGLKYKFMRNNKLIVCEDGTIYKRYRNGLYNKTNGTSVDGGYLHVSIRENRKSKLLLAHRLIAEAFIDNPFLYPQVNHIDGNPSNNNVSNLEWCDAEYNVRDAKKRHSPKYLTNLRAIRMEYGYTAGGMARKLGILQGVYVDIECAVKEPLPIIAIELEKAFGKSIEYLLSEYEGCDKQEES